jgi:CBS domain-containing protein
MRLTDVMERATALVVPEDNIQIAAQTMADSRSDAVLVGSSERLVGVLTARDILIRVTARGLDPAMTPVREIMTPAAEACSEQETAEAVAVRMTERRVDAMPVIDAAGRPVGVVTLRTVEASRLPERTGL